VLQTDNLSVKFLASRSRLAAQHNHEWFATRSRLGFPLVEVEDPSMAAGLGASTPGLSQQSGTGESNDPKSQENHPHGHERSSSAGF
jgi:hypothetical protein